MKTRLVAALGALALIAVACGGGGAATTTTTQATTTTTQATTTTTQGTTTTTAPAIGTDANPIEVLFVPSVSADKIIAGGEILRQNLETATGLKFTVKVPTSYAATLEEICAAPDRTIGFIPAQAYVLGHELCGMSIALKSIRFGYDVYWAEFIVPRNSPAKTLQDLAGKKWAYPDAGSTSGFLVPSGIMKQEGITPGQKFETGGHTATVRAIYNGEADFGTVFYSPPVDANGKVLWDGTKANADVPEADVASCKLTADGGNIDCNGWIPKDARRNLRKEAPDVIQKVRILTLSDPIPNDGMVYGPDFPKDLATKITDAIMAYAKNDPDGFKQAFDAYSWSGVAPATDSEFDSIRAIVQALGIKVSDL